MEAVDLTRSLDGSVLPEAEDALHRAVGASRVAMTVPGVGGSVAWGPNGVFAAEGPQGSGLVEIRNDRTGARAGSVGEHDGEVTGVVFSPDGTALATSGTDGILKAWDPSTGELLMQRAGEGSVEGLSSSAVGSFAASWPSEHLVRVVDPSLNRVRTLRVPGVPASTALSPDGERIAVTTTALAKDFIIVIDVGTGEQVFARGGSGALAWSPNGRSIATTTTNPSVEIFDADSGKHVFGVRGHKGWPTSVTWSPDSSFFASGAVDGEVKVWDVRRDEGGADEVLSLSSAETLDGIGGITFSRDGTRLMIGTDDGTAVKVWDIGFESDAEWADLPASGWLGDVEFLPSGRLAASNPEDTATIWNIETRRPLRTIGSPRDSWYDGEVSVSPDGRSLASSEYHGSVEVWDTVSRAELFTLGGRPKVTDVDWSREGELLVMSMQDGSAVIVDRSGAEVEVLEDEAFRVRIARFSPDGTLVATSGAAPPGEGVWLWDWERARVVSELPISTERFAFDPSGARIATVPPSGGQPEVWDVATGERVAVLAGSSGQVWDVAFSPDGSRVATAAFDATGVRVFDAESGAQLFALPGHDLGAWRLDFSPDGTMLASITAGEIKVWALDIDDLIEIARRELTRSLTDEECLQFLHVAHCPD